jgi:formate dehydrogenase major subunit
MTNSWIDIKNADVILIMGGNAAEAHPCGFKWVTEAKHHNGAKLVVVDPRFTRSAAVADLYCPIRAGTDIAFLLGVVNYLLSNGKVHREYVKAYTNASYIVKEGYGFDEAEGLFTGYNAEKRNYNRDTWEYEIDPATGFAMTDPSLANPRCVYQLLTKHVARYTPEMVSRITGAPQDKFLQVCEQVASTANGERAMTSLYALGWTQHSHGSQNIRCMAMIQLLCGNMGIPGGGVNALRGHSNVQGLTDLGVLSNSIPGYLGMPTDGEPDMATYMKSRDAAFKPLQAGQISFWQNYKKFFVSQLKSMYGKYATPENEFGFEWLPKYDGSYDVLRMFDLVHQGKVNGLICQGFNPLLSVPNKAKMKEGLSKLKFLIAIDPLETETARFWENHGEYNEVNPADIQTEVFMLPSTCFAEDEGSFTNSSRNIMWHWKAADGPGEARTDTQIIAEMFLGIKALYKKEGGSRPDPIYYTDWSYTIPNKPSPDELLRELNGRALADLADPADATKIVKKAGEQLDGFAQMRDDGSTMGACWIYTGVYTEAGNMTARRDTADPSGLGVYPKWGFAWPANRRVLYNRASCDPSGKAWSTRKKYVEWNGAKWVSPDVPDYPGTVAPDKNANPFIMNAEGVARLWVRKGMADGPFPEHYEPFESPTANVLHDKNSANPAARLFKADKEALGTSADFPYVATTYRLTEHFHYWTKHVKINAILQPELFVEISEDLAKEKNIPNGSMVRVWSNRGSIKAKAVVTKRMPTLTIDGKTTHTVGIPIHWGFTGAAKKGFGVNFLTPFVGDANVQTPEYKAFLVNIEPATAAAQV